MIFVKMKADIPHFQGKVVYSTHTLVFYLFYEFESPSQIRFFKSKKRSQMNYFFKKKKGGNLWGCVKTFVSENMESQVSFAPRIIKNI